MRTVTPVTSRPLATSPSPPLTPVAPSDGNASLPASSLSSVVLPDPFTPTTPTRSPGPSCQVTSSSRQRSPAETLTSSSSSTVLPSLAAASLASSTPSLAGGSSAISSLAASIRNFGLVVLAGGPRRNQASSLRSKL